MAIIFFRTIIIFLTLLIFMRLLGKRQLGELELNELVVSVLVANLASLPLQDIGIPLLNGVLPVIILFCCEIVISGATLKSIKLRSLICGRPALLIANGVINQEEMQKNRFTLDELTEQLRGKDILDISKVKYAILETDGTLNAVLYSHEQPAKAAQLGIDVTGPELPSIVINNGRIMTDNLVRLGRDERWLQKVLSQRKCAGAKDVYLMTLSADGEIYFAKKETAQ